MKVPINFSAFPTIIISVYFNFALVETNSEAASDRGRRCPRRSRRPKRRALAAHTAPARGDARDGTCTVQLPPHHPKFILKPEEAQAEPGSESSCQGFRFWLHHDLTVFMAINFSNQSVCTGILGESKNPTLFIHLHSRASSLCSGTLTQLGHAPPVAPVTRQ